MIAVLTNNFTVVIDTWYDGLYLMGYGTKEFRPLLSSTSAGVKFHEAQLLNGPYTGWCC